MLRWGGSLLGKVLEPQFDTQDPCKKARCGGAFLSPQVQMGPGACWQGNQPHLLCESQASERPCLRKHGGWNAHAHTCTHTLQRIRG